MYARLLNEKLGIEIKVYINNKIKKKVNIIQRHQIQIKTKNLKNSNK